MKLWKELLMKAKENSQEDILYLLQDMTDFELYGTVNAIISICDSINYITEEEDLLTVFQLANNYLEKDGIFVFDMNTEYKYKNSTIYTVPVSVENDRRFFNFIDNSDQWKPLEQEKLKINFSVNHLLL